MNNSINNAETKQPAIAQAPKLSEPCTESGLLAQETALAAMGWRGFSRQAKRRLRKIIRSCPILAEAIEEYMPDLAGMLCDIESLDKRKGARRSMACILAKIILGFALRAESSRDMDERIFEGEGACALIYELVGEPPQEFLPHWKACLNAIKLSLSPEAISEIKTALAREIMANPAIRRMRKGPFWEVAIDGTQERSYGSKRHCDRCLTKVHSKKNGKQEWTEYYHSVLEAKLIIGGMAISLISVQMRGPDGDGKQECELSALEKMLACLAFYFPGEQFALLMDALYVSRPAIDEIEHYGYKYIIRFKDAAAATIERQFRDRADAERFEPTLPLQKSSSQAPPVCGFANNISFASPSEERAGNRLSMAERQQKRRT
ncbi:MAG: hypothetical protein FWG30_02660, partial [Eubacteriaceae bacterium]|nr:hypothetical protein [Eubacteriaceae bacterium]